MQALLSADIDFFSDEDIKTPYSDDSTSHPCINEFIERFGRRTKSPLTVAVKPGGATGCNPRTILDVLYHTQADARALREFFA